MAVSLSFLLGGRLAYAQILAPLTNCDPSRPGVYDAKCIGQTVCFNATSTSGTLTGTLTTESANTVFAGPSSGSAAAQASSVAQQI